MSSSEQEVNQQSLPTSVWEPSKAYPLISSGTHSDEFITIPIAIQKIGEGIFGQHWLSEEEAKVFPLGCVNGRYFKLVRNPKYKGKMNRPPKRAYIDGVEKSTLEGAYAKFKEIREKFKSAIDDGAFEIFLTNSRSGITKVDNKYYVIRKINHLVATGRIREPEYENDDPFEMALVRKADFYNWLNDKRAKSRRITSAQAKRIVQRVNSELPDSASLIRKDDLSFIFDKARDRGVIATENFITENIWKEIDQNAKRLGAPGKYAPQFAAGKAKVKEIIEDILGLEVDELS